MKFKKILKHGTPEHKGFLRQFRKEVQNVLNEAGITTQEDVDNTKLNPNYGKEADNGNNSTIFAAKDQQKDKEREDDSEDEDDREKEYSTMMKKDKSKDESEDDSEDEDDREKEYSTMMKKDKSKDDSEDEDDREKEYSTMMKKDKSKDDSEDDSEGTFITINGIEYIIGGRGQVLPEFKDILQRILEEKLPMGYLNSKDDKERMDAVVKFAAFFQEIYKGQLQEFFSILEADNKNDIYLLWVQKILKVIISYIYAKNIADNGEITPEIKEAITKFSSKQQEKFIEYVLDFTKDGAISHQLYTEVIELAKVLGKQEKEYVVLDKKEKVVQETEVVLDKQEKVIQETFEEITMLISNGVLTQDEATKIMNSILGNDAADDHPL